MRLAEELAAALEPSRVLARPLDLAAYASDASFYTLTPEAVVRPESVEEIRTLFALARRRRVPLTFRAAGTSLSGQAVGAGIVVDVSKHWRTLEVEDAGARVRVGPGVVGGFVNRVLARHGAKLGPDPASIDACMIGGILANNSSGMCCGIEQNAYRTVESLIFVLPSGTVLDTSRPGAEAELAAREPRIAAGLLELRRRILGDAALTARIERKYRMKNTMGYALNAFVDFDTPLEILRHLLIGSEGTLAFLAEAVFRTVPDHPFKSAGLLLFEDVHAACASVESLRASGAAAIELLDRASLRSVETYPGIPAVVAELAPPSAAILTEYQAPSVEALEGHEATFRDLESRLPLLHPFALTRDPVARGRLWSARKGLIASVGAMRPRGTTLLFEDLCFPVEHLPDGVLELQRLFAKHGYPDGVVFGHAKDGNVHFLISQSFNDQASVEQYARFTDDVVEMTVGRFDGALKAEHGTGRNMAPFVETEWGPDAYAIMKAVKDLVDPEGILNPGVILNDNPRIHLENLKELPEVEDEVDRCIECGFCESKCPSRDLTLTPRQRIVLRREQARLRKRGDDPAPLEADLPYDSLDTCAADGMCATACPVGIDTGKLVKRLRHDAHAPLAREAARAIAERLGWIEPWLRGGLRVGRALPGWPVDMPLSPQRDLPRTSPHGAAAVYVPTCVTRILGEDDPERGSLPEVIARVSRRAGARVTIPDGIAGFCCGMPFSSKGYAEAAAEALHAAIDRLWEWTGEGVLPVVIDTSPCALTLRSCRESLDPGRRRRFDALTILDGIEFAHDVLLPRLAVRPLPRSVVLHPVCSAVKLGIEGKLLAVARACAAEAAFPLAAGCCGFAGDRGFTHPELTAAATRAEAAEVGTRAWDGFYASSRTCEIGMTRATGKPYRSFWCLLDEATA